MFDLFLFLFINFWERIVFLIVYLIFVCLFSMFLILNLLVVYTYLYKHIESLKPFCESKFSLVHVFHFDGQIVR